MSPKRRRAAKPPRSTEDPTRSPASGATPGAPASTAPGRSVTGWRLLYLPLAVVLALGVLSLTERVQSSARLAMSFQGAAALVAVWWIVLQTRLRSADAPPTLLTHLRPQHWIQALCQIAVFAYWGWFWRPVYDMALLIGAQIVFAYGVDMLIAWTRRRPYVLGFGPFPIIFSINLFLWFRDDWFHLQFLMVLVGFLGKELVRWERDGRRVHIFNPSAFALGLFSLVLIATNSTTLTWGQEIASTLTLAPGIYSYLFAVGLIVMYFFSITLVAGFAAAVLFGASAVYGAATGVPYFIDSEIPAAVFLGLHLLVTDPSTSPRTPGGKAVFGMLYGVGVFALYTVLGSVGAPTFYDKLLCVPLLNLSVRGIDGVMARLRASDALAPFRLEWSPFRLNLAHMAVWVVFFGAMTGLGRTDGTHPGDRLPFWEEACAQGRPTACDRLLQLEATYCGDASAWACNELGAHYAEGALVEPDPELAFGYFSRACELRYQPGCVNLLEPERVVRAEPKPLDLRLLLREGGLNLMEMPERQLYERACGHDWAFACATTTGAP